MSDKEIERLNEKKFKYKQDLESLLGKLKNKMATIGETIEELKNFGLKPRQRYWYECIVEQNCLHFYCSTPDKEHVIICSIYLDSYNVSKLIELLKVRKDCSSLIKIKEYDIMRYFEDRFYLTESVIFKSNIQHAINK